MTNITQSLIDILTAEGYVVISPDEIKSPPFPLSNRFTVGERCLQPGYSGSYPNHKKDRWGYVSEIKQTVVTQVVESLIVSFDDGETRAINPDVIAHGDDWRYKDPKNAKETIPNEV